MPKVEITNPPDVAPGLTYSHVARAGDFVFVAGQIAKDAHGNWVQGDASDQARAIYRNIDRILDHVGATKEDIVKVNTILVDLQDKDPVTAVRLEYFGSLRPPHTGTVVAALGFPEIRMEVEIIVYLPRKGAV
ncbi:RidA family protein [Szabonella alba]|uniref:RidA family protein n=1 Tax=Szabonella alba TaxID=2804194 RepID=A0A8K0VDM8_9RHOB|nr:RidA family protein [Szabonella alba]MBL4919176.1 RidA family protein [Szabonella alba]